MKRKFKNQSIVYLTLIVLALFTLPAMANLSSTAKLGIEGSYNDNIFFIDEDRPTQAELDGEEVSEEELIDPETGKPFLRERELSDYQLIISPEIQIEYQTDRSKADFDGKLDFINHRDLTELNDIDYHLKGDFTHEVTEYTKLGFNASYLRDSQSDRDLQTSGLIIGTYLRDKQEYGLNAEHELTPLSKLGASYTYQQEDFVASDLDDEIEAILQAQINAQQLENPTPETADHELLTPAEELLQAREADDSNLHSTAFSFMYDIGDKLPDGVFFTSASYMHLTTHQSTQNNVMGLVGLSYMVKEKIKMSVDGGLRYSHEKYDDIQLQLLTEAPYYNQLNIEQTQDSWGPVAHTEIQYLGYLTDARLKASFDVQPASGSGTFTERAGLQLDISRQLSESFRVRGFSSYFDNNRDGIKQLSPVASVEALEVHNGIPQLQERLAEETKRLNAVDKVTVNLGLELKYTINEYFDLIGQYNYTMVKQNELESDARRNRVFLRLDCNYSI
jgi:hypothetical protein